jgi:DNA-binding winged helix-turn-helix (wHTH) protein
MFDDLRNLLSGKSMYNLGFMLLLSIAVICVVFSISDGNDFAISRREVLLRKIGHELLLQSGDSTSRVLPIKKITQNEYLISFENELTFQTDSLVNTTQRLLAKDPLTNDYVVNVLNTGKSGVAYGYAISENKKDDIIACKGRNQPRAPYLINIKFKPSSLNTARSRYLLGALPILAFMGFMFLRSVKPQKHLTNNQYTTTLQLGAVLFDAQNRKLIINGSAVDLTRTETRVLRIFANCPNQTIERTRLQKEIWEDEGVIVGRSLDMFISKLRKKLEGDPAIKIVAIRSKGYRFEITS